MKNAAKLIGFIAILAFIGLCFSACDEPKSEPDPVFNELPALTGTVSITGTTQVGKMLTANISALGGSGTISFEWERDYSNTIGSNGTYMVQESDVGSTITVTVTRANNSGSVISNPTDVITPNNLPALTGTVIIIGIAEVGETLTADIGGLGGDGYIEYYWKSHGYVVGYDSSYTVQDYDIGSTITVTVARSENAGSVISAPTNIVSTPGLAFTLINNGTAYSVSKGTATTAEIVIPAIHEGLPVTEITDSGFTNYTDLTSIIIPSGVTKIGNYAFFHCGNLASVVIPSGITNIGNFAFSDCGSLNTVYFGGSSNAEWTAMTMGSNNTQLINASRYYYSAAFQGTPDTHWRFIDGDPTVWAVLYFSLINNGTAYEVSGAEDFIVGEIIIPTIYNDLPVTKIADYGFSNIFNDPLNLISIIIPNSIISIGNNAFQGCIGLTSITISSSVTTIGNNVFLDCANLLSFHVDINNINYASQDGILYNKDKTQLIKCPLGVSGSFTIPNSVTSISRGAFSGCTGLTSITIPFVGATLNDTTNTHFGYIFGAYSSSNQNTSIPSSIKTVVVTGGNNINHSAFFGCTGLTSITIPNSITSIGNAAFSGCTGLTSITIPSSVMSIGGSAFEGCTGLTSITIPFVGATLNGTSNAYFGYIFGAGYYSNQNTSIPSSLKTVVVTGGNSINGAFSGCTGLTSVTIPDSVTSIGWEAFSGCTGLTSITIPNGVTSIGNSAFRYCTGLTSITIPDSVTSIGSGAFSGCTSLTSITIPFVDNTLNGTSNTVFSYIFGSAQSSLKTVVVTGGESIGNHAFSGCSGLTSITIPSSVTSIGEWAFEGCYSLTSITVDSANVNYASQDGILYNKDKTQLIKCPLGGVSGSFTIPDSVTSIGSYAFFDCTGLTSLTIPNSVTSIGSGAFYNCKSLMSITIPFVGSTLNGTTNTHFGYIFGAHSSSDQNTNIPSSLKTVVVTGGESISNRAFFGCTGLTSITIPGSVTSIGWDAFYGCSSLTSITIGSGVTSIGGNAFSGCSGLTSITIPNSVTSIGSGAFYNCPGLTSITIPFVGATLNGTTNTSFGYIFASSDYSQNYSIPSSLKTVVVTGGNSIGGNAFYGCSSLTSITIGSGVTSIGGNAFIGCTGLTSITVDSANTNYSSQDCILYNKAKTNIIYVPMGISGSVTIPSSVTSIGEGAFSSRTGITSITIPSSVTSIGNLAFSGCTGLTSITIPSSVTNIGEGAFYCCTGLTSITIPDSVTSIVDSNNSSNIGVYNGNNGVFEGCTSLIDITIPNSVKGIGSYAFQNCTSLTSITIPSSVTSIGYSAFAGCTGLTSITIPNSVTSIGGFAFSYCTGLTNITIPDSVTGISGYTFIACTSLTSITFMGTILESNFSYNAFSYNGGSGYIGDLRAKYLAGGIGTYTRQAGSMTWMKQ